MAEAVKIECPANPPKPPKIARRQVYETTPFKAGEKMVFEVTWAGLKVGYATMETRSPRRYLGLWHRIFHLSARTGDWFKTIFIAEEKAEAISRPWDFGVSKFYMKQKEGKLFGSDFRQEKWLEFDHDKCKVQELIKQPGKKDKNKTHDLAYGAIDALGVVYQIRTRDYQLGKVERAPVYTSEKNWYLEADPQKFETIKVPAGTFETVKMKLTTYLGKELQQKGDVYAWIAHTHPNRPLVQLQGEIKIGSVWIKLHKFQPGS